MTQDGNAGTTEKRPDAWAKISGEARFVDDLDFPGAWYGGTVRSTTPRGRIRSISWDPAFDRSTVVFLTAEDLPGPNVVSMIKDDHPILAKEEVQFFSEPIALIAAPSQEILEAALSAVRVEITDEPPVLTIEDSLAKNAIIWGADNVISDYRITRGDVAAGLLQADLVCEGTYRTGHQEHLYLEPNGLVATPLPGGGVEILGSLQCPYYIRNALSKALKLPGEKVVVRQAVTGGAFGGKEDFPSVLGAHAALLALRSGHPVKMVYGRSEDIRSTTKRHPSRTQIRAGVMKDGTLRAIEIDFVLDGGAYATMSPVVLSRGLLHSGGAYRWPHAVLRGRAVATNTPPNGAFRGFGVPQSIFAIERHMDRIAHTLGLDPLEIRRKNLLRPGDTLPFGQTLLDGVGASLVLERAVALSGYEERRKAAGTIGDGETRHGSGRTRRGVGLSLYLHGGGFTGSGEDKISGRVQVQFTAEGILEVLVSSVEMGQGASTVLSLIAARTLGIPLEKVRHPLPDTSRVPDSGPTVASRTTMVVGRIVLDACCDLAAKLRVAVAGRFAVDEKRLDLKAGTFVTDGKPVISLLEAAAWFVRENGELIGQAAYVPVPGSKWDDATYTGEAYKAYSWGADVIEVEVDQETMEIRPVKATVVVEIGRAIHPVLAAGQVEGGTLQGIGLASMEEIKLEGGRYLNDRMATYVIPTALDTPAFEVEIAELPYERGPFGAKGLGELPADGAAPAMAEAISQATGLVQDELPITPERLLLMQDAAGPASTGGAA